VTRPVWDSNSPIDANILILLALGDATRATYRKGPTEALEKELATHCREGTWSCDVDLAGCQGRFPNLVPPERRLIRGRAVCRRRQVAGDVPTIALNARLNAASD
jgi:hypothetical protein